MSFTVELPAPISANHLFANVPGRGRVKTKAYENWQSVAALTVVATVRADQRIGGRVAVRIELPAKCRLDIDNAIKPILDALVRSRRIDDDRNVARLEVSREAAGNLTVVTVTAFEQIWPKRVAA